jgi:hypothetical protein
MTETTETTITEFCGVPGNFNELRHRWLNITIPTLQDEALLQSVPADWIDTVIAHFREHCLSQVTGETYKEFSENAKDLFHQLVYEMASCLAGEVLTLDEQIRLNEDLAARGTI